MRVVVLCSGNGSNLQAMIDAQQAAKLGSASIVGVVVNIATAKSIERAQKAGIAVSVCEHQHYPTRLAFDLAMMEIIDSYQPDLVVLAGFMRILTPEFVRHYAGKLINIHPSLLPAYKGLHTHQRVLNTGDRWHGCTIHYVTEELDAGAVIAQKRLEVPLNISAEQLANKVHKLEHQLYPEVIASLAEQCSIANMDK